MEKDMTKGRPLPVILKVYASSYYWKHFSAAL